MRAKRVTIHHQHRIKGADRFYILFLDGLTQSFKCLFDLLRQSLIGIDVFVIQRGIKKDIAIQTAGVPK
jgi:hypothetical protein